MDDIIYCDCGSKVTKKHLKRHLTTKRHQDFKKEEIKEEVKEPEKEPEKEEEEEEEEEQKDEEQEEEEEKEEEEKKVEIKSTPTIKKKGQSKEHMDAIRQKALMTINRKKQMKIQKENEIIKKAEQYDILVKQLKEKEENEKKQKEEQKIKEMEYKSNQYDKILKQQQRNNTIASLSNEKIIDDIKEQRLNYLMRYLQNPNMY